MGRYVTRVHCVDVENSGSSEPGRRQWASRLCNNTNGKYTMCPGSASEREITQRMDDIIEMVTVDSVVGSVHQIPEAGEIPSVKPVSSPRAALWPVPLSLALDVCVDKKVMVCDT